MQHDVDHNSEQLVQAIFSVCTTPDALKHAALVAVSDACRAAVFAGEFQEYIAGGPAAGVLRARSRALMGIVALIDCDRDP